MYDCIGDPNSEICITTAYRFGDRTLCTADEAGHVAAAWRASAQAREGDAKAIKAGNAVADAIIAGRVAEGPKVPACG